MIYTPEAWCILKINYKGKMHYRVFAGWYGGYLGGDSWKLNSGIVNVHTEGDFYEFTGESGSIYRCHKDLERMTGYMTQIYLSLTSDNNDERHIKYVPYFTVNLELKEKTAKQPVNPEEVYSPHTKVI